MSKEKRMMNRRKSNNRNSKTIKKKTITEHITNIVSNKKLLVVMIVSMITLATLLSTSFAMLMKSASSDKQDLYESGTLTVQLDKASEGEAITINPAKPISDEYGMATVKPYTFTITNTGTTNASYEVYLDETITNSNNLSDDEVRQYIRYQIDDESPRSLGGQGSNIIVRGGIHPEEELTFKLKLWVDLDAPNSMEGTTYSARVGVKGKATNRMQPNGPEIVDGLIPVVYDEKNDVWKKADTSTSWYNYEKQKWANAVTVTSNKRDTYLSAKAGTTIDMNDINSMWVWIPRYKYRIPDHIGSTTNVSNPPEIDIIFESRYNATGVEENIYRSSIQDDGTINDSVNNGEKIYYTHPTFRNGKEVNNGTEYDMGGWDRELTGMWAAKFETGTDNNLCNENPSIVNCENVDPIIKPDLRLSLLAQPVKNMFEISLKFVGGTFNNETGEVKFEKNEKYGLNTNCNTHMMKNTEWGAVAYLSQSRYGKKGNKNYEGTNKEIYKNDSRLSSVIGSISGRSQGFAPATSQSSEAGTYSYNDYKCEKNDTIYCTGNKEKYKGTGASTTGTIYGIYDMVGGLNEYVMANLNGNVYTDTSNFKVFPSNPKYYDLYNNTNESFKEKSILGDATWETMRWYSDTYLISENGWPWFYRSYKSNNGIASGIFFCQNSNGGAYANDVTFRVSLIP